MSNNNISNNILYIWNFKSSFKFFYINYDNIISTHRLFTNKFYKNIYNICIA